MITDNFHDIYSELVKPISLIDLLSKWGRSASRLFHIKRYVNIILLISAYFPFIVRFEYEVEENVSLKLSLAQLLVNILKYTKVSIFS